MTSLVRARCRCGALALAVAERAAGARCGICIREDAGAPSVHPASPITPVIGARIGGTPRAARPAEPWPAPVITSRQTDRWEDCWPASPAALARLAVKNGFRAHTGFSRGYVPGAAAGSHVLADMIGVWLDGHGHRACATWLRKPESPTLSAQAWSAHSVIIWQDYRPLGFPYANQTDLKAWVAARGAVSSEWFGNIRAWVLAHRERDARRPAARGGVVRENGG